MTNAQIADTLEQIAELLEFKGENPFRVRAYRNAARTIADYHRAIEEMVRDPEADLTEIDGIGRDLAEKLTRLVRTGKIPLLEELKAQIPESVLAILRVPGVGPKRASALFHELGIRTLEELRDACIAQRIRGLKGFGAKIEAAILEGLEIASEADKRIVWAEADARAQLLLAHLRECDAIARIEIAGSFRRKKETVGDLTSSSWPPTRPERWTTSPPTPAWAKSRPAATPRCRSAWPASSRSISASCPRNRSAPPCNTSPAPRRTTSSCAAWPRTAT